jgi:hypothetical protein
MTQNRQARQAVQYSQSLLQLLLGVWAWCVGWLRLAFALVRHPQRVVLRWVKLVMAVCWFDLVVRMSVARLGVV